VKTDQTRIVEIAQILVAPVIENDGNF
jgi:hypothetical protein